MKKPRYKAIERANTRLFNHEWAKPEKKIYATEYLVNDDMDFQEAIKDMNKLTESDYESYRLHLKAAADAVRKATERKCVVGFTFAERISDGEEVLLIHFYPEVEAIDANYFNMHLDKVKNIPYLILKNGVKS